MTDRVVGDRLRRIVYKRLEDLEEHVEIDETALTNYLQKVRENQNLPLAILSGCIAAFMGAVLWALIAAAINRHFALLAIGLGALVGLTIRRFGQGFDRAFGIVGALLAIGGCAGGILLTVCVLASRAYEVPFFSLMSKLAVGDYLKILELSFSPVHVIFYIVAIYEGYRFSIRRISDTELRTFTHK